MEPVELDFKGSSSGLDVCHVTLGRFTHFSKIIWVFLVFCLFIYFWLCWVFVAVRGLSLVVASKGYSSLQCAGFSLQ